MANPRARYRVICFELTEDGETVIIDSTDDGFIAATGSIHDDVLEAELAHAGPYELQAHLALMIANDEQLHTHHQLKHKPTR